jgi:hypothetical protein
MAAFVTLCEAYMGIKPHFNMWNYFLHAWLLQGSSAKAEVLGSVDLYLISRQGGVNAGGTGVTDVVGARGVDEAGAG